MKRSKAIKSIVAASILSATNVYATTVIGDTLVLPAFNNSDSVTLDNEFQPTAPLEAEVMVEVGDIGSARVQFEFDFGGFGLVASDDLPIIISGTNSNDNVFIPEEDQSNEQLQSFDDKAAFLSSFPELSGTELSPSNTFIAILTGRDPNTESYSGYYSFAGADDQTIWNAGLLSAGTYGLEVFSVFDAYGRGNITISAVPIPAAAILFGTALVGFAGFSARRKA